MLEEIRKIVRGDQVIDSHEFNVRIRRPGTKNQSSNTTKSIDANFDGHSGAPFALKR
jgi:hypothetical protein